MPSLDKDLSLTERLEQFKILYRYYSLEMQLIWLTDIIAMYCCEYLTSKGRETKSSQSISVDLICIILKRDNLNYKYVKKLFAYRNAYVHKGPKYAISAFNVLRNEYMSELSETASHFGLQLNWNFVIYDNLANQAKAYINMK